MCCCGCGVQPRCGAEAALLVRRRGSERYREPAPVAPDQGTDAGPSARAPGDGAPLDARARSQAMTHMDAYILPADEAQAAPGVQRLDVSAVNRKARSRPLCRSPEDLSEARARPLPRHQVGGDGHHARHLLRAAVAALGPRPGPARSGRAARHGQQPLLFLLPRDLAAGVLLRHRPADAGRARPVPRHVGSPAASGAATPARRPSGPI